MSAHKPAAAEWFNQFTGYLAEHPEVQGRDQWCRRHWAPCPAFGANGIGAAMEMMQVFVSEIKPPGASSPSALNRELAKASPVCCYLGDERMYELWGHWPPSGGHGD